MVSAARRRAARDGDRQIDTAHLLHSLFESDRAVWDLLEGGSPQVGRLLGYLVQRSVGYGLRWQGTVEDSGAVPEVADQPGGVPGLSPSAAAALAVARQCARRRGADAAEGADLFVGLLSDPDCRGAEVLRHAGVDTERLATRLRVRGTSGDTPDGA
ncbi:peptidase [Streptomyces sp. AJS327]|uniref:Clp protease N-terminal domain-containing protein n=1 Tax=Streptomyces sp. AJS327 TaxID=2545265 RepID=UPI0015DF7BC1|nr:Clp protease N-terminal domain-containing protein [Streptomyces sp. AJS327]MBA0051073.1 peptidase [Streptomyces sp. AJS327]